VLAQVFRWQKPRHFTALDSVTSGQGNPVLSPDLTLDTVPKLLLHNARAITGRPAVRQKDFGIWQTWTWRETLNQVRAFSIGLAELGLKPGTHCPLGVILMGLGVAKVDKYAIAQILPHEAAETAHGFSDAFRIGRDEFSQVFRIHAR
jgi:hypothetical protein